MMKVILIFFSIFAFLQASANEESSRLVIYPTTTPWSIAGVTHFQAFNARVFGGDRLTFPLGAIRNVGVGDFADSIEIRIQTQSGQQSTLSLPQQTTQNLLRFLEVGTPANIICDCHCFAARLIGNNYPHSYSGGTYNPMGNVLSDFDEHFTEINGQAQLNPGDAIMMARTIDENGSFSTDHSAVYLGEGLYLSKLGHDGGLVVTTFQEIRNAYPSDRFFRYEPDGSRGTAQPSLIEEVETPVQATL